MATDLDGHRTIRARAAEGRRIAHVYDCDHGWKEFPSDVRVPDKDKLFTFDLPLGKGKKERILVLDNYGDEVLPDRIRRQVLNDTMFANTIGIHRKTGEIVHVGFFETNGLAPGTKVTSAAFWRPGPSGGGGDGLFVPKRYILRLDELKSKKRPFYISLCEQEVYAFITRWSSYGDLQDNIVVDLDFDGNRVQVWGDSYREIGSWQDVPNHPKRAEER